MSNVEQGMSNFEVFFFNASRLDILIIEKRGMLPLVKAKGRLDPILQPKVRVSAAFWYVVNQECNQQHYNCTKSDGYNRI